MNAASIGESLTSPDEGWKRYDDMDPFIKYEGVGWSHVTDDVNTYGDQVISINYPAQHQTQLSLNFMELSCELLMSTGTTE